jgi:hypothetical protein
MESDARVPRYLGAAFLVVFATSLASGVLSGPILTGPIPAILANISNHLTQMRASNVLQLLTSIGIVVLASLLYVVLKDQSRIVALVALGWWLGEAVMLAVSTLGVYSLVSLSLEYVKAGTPASSYYQTLGTLCLGIEQNAYSIHVLFFCLGAVLWYYLFFQSRVVPRWLSLWGLLSVSLLLVNMLLIVWDRGLDVGLALEIPYIPFELVIGIWLLVSGGSELSQADRLTRG